MVWQIVNFFIFRFVELLNQFFFGVYNWKHCKQKYEKQSSLEFHWKCNENYTYKALFMFYP